MENEKIALEVWSKGVEISNKLSMQHYRDWDRCAKPILDALTEAHERGRKDGLEVAIQTILAEARFQEDQRSLKESIVLRNVAESIRTAMEGKDGE